ncbi:MAG TPA: SBBP repeat-containing protein, partial [Bacteroidota bacterium]|nr:SBBP repeat-containing protein [Bacteroidota bacterium]
MSHRTRISLGSHSITAGNAQDRTVLGAPGDTVALAWSYLYSSGIPSANDQATDLAIDSHDGSVYVAGSSYSATTGFDILIVKFTSGGDTIWTRRFNGRGNGDDYTAAIGVDSSGNVIVVGSSAAVDTTDDFVTLKYSPAGILLWTRYYDGPINEYDDPADLVIDNANNIYVTGSSEGRDTLDEYATIEYTSGGDSVWMSRYLSARKYECDPLGIALDNLGNVIVTGTRFDTLGV